MGLDEFLKAIGAENPGHSDIYTAFFVSPESIHEDKREIIKSEITDIIKKLVDKNPEFAKCMKNAMVKMPKYDSQGLPELNIEPWCENIGTDFNVFIANLAQKSKVLASAADIYRFFKILRVWNEKGDYKKVAEANGQIEKFRKNFTEINAYPYIITSTKLLYRQTKGIAEAVHRFGFKNIEPIIRTAKMPVCSGGRMPLQKFLTDPAQGDPKDLLEFMQAILDTDDDVDAICNTLGHIFGNTPAAICINYTSLEQFLESDIFFSRWENLGTISYSQKGLPNGCCAHAYCLRDNACVAENNSVCEDYL